MSDYKKFKDMTKPLKFRPIKRMWNTTRDVISNKYYYILYKLNILDYISNEDRIPTQCATLKSEEGYIVANKVMCDVEVRVVETRYISYAYYKTRKGKVIPIYDDEYAILKFIGVLTNVAFNFDGSSYRSVIFDNKIRFNEVPEISLAPYEPEELLKEMKVKSVEVDISPVLNARVEKVLNGYYSDVQSHVFSSIYMKCISEFERFIKDIDWEEHTERRI